MTERIAPHQHSLIRDKSERGNGATTSANWSGYAVTGSSFTSAQASWIVPSANCSGNTSNLYAAFWVGIDGYSSTTVEQTGTESDCNGTTPSYYAWYEFYPNPSFEVTSVPVQPGDKISASVTYSGLRFTVTLTDETTGASFTKTAFVPGADRSSAEWIAEAPCCTLSGGVLPMTNFGTVEFGMDQTGIRGTNAATDSAQSGPIGSFPSANVFEINKVGARTSPQTTTCSILSNDGTSFSCTWASK